MNKKLETWYLTASAVHGLAAVAIIAVVVVKSLYLFRNPCSNIRCKARINNGWLLVKSFHYHSKIIFNDLILLNLLWFIDLSFMQIIWFSLHEIKHSYKQVILENHHIVEPQLISVIRWWGFPLIKDNVWSRHIKNKHASRLHHYANTRAFCLKCETVLYMVICFLNHEIYLGIRT